MQRVTITISDETLARVRSHVAAGGAPSVSAYLAGLADDGTRGDELLAAVEAVEAAHGRPTPDEAAWAQTVIPGRSRSTPAR